MVYCEQVLANVSFVRKGRQAYTEKKRAGQIGRAATKRKIGLPW